MPSSPTACRTLSALVATALLVLSHVGCTLGRVRPDPSAESTAAPDRVSYPHLVLRLGERRVYLHEHESAPPESFPVAIGRKPWETPTGRFEVIQMIENPDFVRIDWKDPSRTFGRIPPGPNNPLGLRWIAFTHAHGWAIGFHGTTKTHLLGQAVSHGCVRMSNGDVMKIYDRVKLGTPVIVEP
jgi:lipoprotein-anchoring transpeptidase ErfK/SrfK